MKLVIVLCVVVLTLIDYGYTVDVDNVHIGETEKAFTKNLGDKYKL